MTNRREWLKMSGGGLGALAFDCLRAEETRKTVHHPAKAKRVIQIFCPGGMSQVDTFDYKPELAKRAGKPCLLYTSPSPRDGLLSRMPSSA